MRLFQYLSNTSYIINYIIFKLSDHDDYFYVLIKSLVNNSKYLILRKYSSVIRYLNNVRMALKFLAS